MELINISDRSLINSILISTKISVYIYMVENINIVMTGYCRYCAIIFMLKSGCFVEHIFTCNMPICGSMEGTYSVWEKDPIATHSWAVIFL